MFLWLYQQIRKVPAKRIMSLVLVVAMLASFVGMSGYVPGAFTADAVALNGTTAYTTIERADSTYTPNNITYSSTTKPKDSYAGKQPSGVSIDVPTFLYSYNNAIVNNTSSLAGTTANNNDNALRSGVTVTVPGAKKIAVYVIKKDQNTSNLSKPTDVIMLSAESSSSPATFDLNGKATSAISEDGTYVYFRIDYTVSATNDFGEARDVTYTQYAVSKITTIPKYKLTNSYWSAGNHQDGTDNKKTDMFAYQTVNLAAFLNRNGFAITWMGSNGKTPEGGDGGTSGYKSNASDTLDWGSEKTPEISPFMDDATFMHNMESNRAKYDGDKHFGMGWQSATGETFAEANGYNMGATIKYDKTAASTSAVNASIYSYVKTTSEGNNAVIFTPSGSYYHIYGANVRNESTLWQGTDVNDSTDQSSSTTDIQFKDASGNVTSWTNGLSQLSNQTQSTTVRMDFNTAIFSNTTAKTYVMLTRFYGDCDDANDEGTMYIYNAYYFKFEGVDLTNSHNVINAAKSGNYVKAEMDYAWWTNYRNAVIQAYTNCADLSTTYETAAATNLTNVINAPVFATADYSELYAAFIDTPAWEWGNSDKTAHDGVNRVSPFNDKTRYGDKYYTEATWGAYATARNTAYKELHNPKENISTYNYGSIYNINKTTEAGCFCYNQTDITNAKNALVNAKNALVLDLANVSALGAAIDAAMYDPVITTELVSQIKNKNGYETNSYAYYLAIMSVAFKVYNDNTNMGDPVAGANYGSVTHIKNDDFRQDPPLYDSGDQYYDPSAGGLTSFPPFENRQAEIDWLTTKLIDAHSKLVRKTLADYTDTLGNGYQNIVNNIDSAIETLDNKTYTFYSFENNALVSNTEELYTAAQIATLTAVSARLKSELAASDLYYVEADNLKALIKAYNDALAEVKAAPAAVNTDAWYAMVNQIGSNLGVSVDGSTFSNAIAAVYKDFDTATVNAISNKFIAAIKTDAENNQPAMNTIISDLYNAINVEKQVTELITAADDVYTNATKADLKFNVYDYEHTKQGLYANQKLDPYTAESLNELQTQANALGDATYNVLTTTKATINANKTTITNFGVVDGGIDHDGCLLVNQGAVTEYMETAIAYAQQKLAEKATAINPDTLGDNPVAGAANKEFDKFTAKSVAELNYIIGLANYLLTTDKVNDKDNQWEFDRLTFAIYEEADDGLKYMLPANIGFDYASFTYSGDAVTGITWGMLDSEWEDYLYSTGTRKENFNGMNRGLEPGAACFDFVVNEMKNNNSAQFQGIWELQADGTYAPIMNSDGTYPGSALYNNWDAYVAAFEAAKTANSNQASYTSATQADVDTVAKNLHDAYAALTLKNFSANTVPYQQAQAYYQAFSAMVNAKADVNRYTVTAEDRSTYSKTTDEIDLYTNVDQAFIDAISAFGKAYAADVPTAGYDSEEAMNAAYEAIQARIDSGEIQPRSMSDELITAGFNDLINNFIAGEFDGSAYTTNLLNATQAAAIEAYLVDAQVFIDTEVADVKELATTIGYLNAKLDELYSYTTTHRATDMQFAVGMREEVEGFFGMSYTAEEFLMEGSNYYYGDTIPEDVYYVFDQNAVQNNIYTYIDAVLDVESNWPLIYTVHGLETDNDSGVWQVAAFDCSAPGNGYARNKGTATVADTSIVKILNQVASRCGYYAELYSYINNFNLESMQWIARNAIYAHTDGITYVAATATPNDLGYPVTYEPIWYDGSAPGIEINGQVYYPYADDGDSYGTSIYNGNGGWFTGGFDETDIFLNLSEFGVDSYDTLENMASIAADEWGIGYGTEYLKNIADEGWEPGYQESVLSGITWIQYLIEADAQNYYDSGVNSLALLPATNAYRQLVTLYQSINGIKVDYSVGGYESYYNHFVPDTSTETSWLSTGGVFYQSADDDEFSDMLFTLTNKTLDDDEFTIDEFSGLVTGSSGILPGQYAKDENWDAFVAFYQEIIGGDMVTIDYQDTVNGPTDSLLTKMYEYIDGLKLQGHDFKNLNKLISAFFYNQPVDFTKFGPINNFDDGFKTDYTLTETYYYAYNYYTEQSLAQVVRWMYEQNLISQNIKDMVYTLDADGYVVPNGFTFSLIFDGSSPDHTGTFYQNVKFGGDVAQAAIEAITSALARQINSLVLAPAVLDDLEDEYNNALKIIEQEALYDSVSSEGKPLWDEFIAAKDAAYEMLFEMSGLTLAVDQDREDGVDARKAALTDAISKLKKRADEKAPVMDVQSTKNEVEQFYRDTLKDDTTVPGITTFMMPNGSGYSLMVYTNQLNPRIVLGLNDVSETVGSNAEGGSLDIPASKNEKFNVSASRTAGTVPNVILGKIGSNGVATYGVYNVASDGDGNTQIIGSGETGSSVFAVLAPDFVADKRTQAALYKISAEDGNKNITTELKVGIDEYGNDVITTIDTSQITVYVYYMNTMPADGNTEGINNGAAVGDAPAVFSQHEPDPDGETWSYDYWLNRSFTGVKSWEFVSAVVDSTVNDATNVPIYNDPVFGTMNTGSFAYILDSSVTTDASIISDYHADKTASAMNIDYAAATVAMTKLRDAIKADADVFTAMKATDRFIEFGSYDYWQQRVTTDYPNGTLIFIHVLDRWGNYCDRVVEVTAFDRYSPEITADDNNKGVAQVVEKGGSGIKSINMWDWLSNETQYEDVTFENSGNQSVKVDTVVGNGMTTTVSVSGNTVTLSGFTPGKKFEIGVTDNSGRHSQTTVFADKDGNFTLTVIDEGDFDTIQSNVGEQTAFMAFTLNDFATVMLNSVDSSSVIDATTEGNVFANKKIWHYIDTLANVTQLKIENTATGEVDEWTTSTAKVTTNDDGTLTWRVYRTLAEGEHSFKVWAMVNGEYEQLSVPFTITATTKTVKLTQTILGLGYTNLSYSGSKDILTTAYKTETVPYGAVVKLSALVNKEDREFKYWINDNTNRIISTDAVLEFKAVSNIDYVAQFTSSATYYDGKKVVIYVNNANNIIKTFELAEGETYAIPAAPALPDYVFRGWSMSQAEVLASTSDTVIVRPVYTLSGTNVVTITAGDYTTSGAGSYAAAGGERPIVNINASATNGAGESFLYWFDEETQQIASYSRLYTFYCLRDITLTPVYGEPQATGTKAAIRIADINFAADTGKVTFYAERSIPEELEVLQTGIVVTKTQDVGENEAEFVLGGTGTAAGTSTSTASNGYYSASVNVFDGETVWARGYVICENALGDIVYVYGPVVSYSAN